MSAILLSSIDLAQSSKEFLSSEKTAHAYMQWIGCEPVQPVVFAGVDTETVLYVTDASIRDQLLRKRKHKRIEIAPAYLLSGEFGDLASTGDWRSQVHSREQLEQQGIVRESDRQPYVWTRFTGFEAPLILTRNGIIVDHTKMQSHNNVKRRLTMENIYQFDTSAFVGGYTIVPTNQ